MRPKKKDQTVQPPVPDIEEDREKFIQAFQKPTKIYRYMRTRHIVTPVFLQRSLHYMKHRRSTSSNKRESFKVDSLFEKKNPVCKQEQQDERNGCTDDKFLRLEFVGFYNDQVASGTREVEVEAIVTKIHHTKKDGGSSQIVKQTCLGKVSVPVNPGETPCNQSSLDGTQSDGFQPYAALIVSREGFKFTKKKSIQSCVLLLSVTCHSKHPRSNGVTNGSNGDASESEEPRSKRRRSEASAAPVAARHVSVDDDEVVVYGTELYMYGGHDQCLLKNGDYEHCLQELGSKSPTKKDVTIESANGKKVVSSLDMFGACPKLKFKLCWTDDAEGAHPCKDSPSEFLSNNRLSNTNFSGFGIDSSPLKLKEEHSTPQKKVSVTYHFLYDNNTRQQTDTRNNLHCPWCSVNCDRLYSLLRHLRLCHARFNFIYVPCPKGARIDVSVNDSYDGSYMGDPQDLNSHIGFAFSRLGPVRRTSITHVMVYRPNRPVDSLLEFYEPEKENQVTRQIVQGHNRLYYRTATCLPLKPQEVTHDSEDESSPLWLQQKSINLIDEFTDVNEGEKELMKLWNVHCMQHAYIADCQIPLACESFVKEHGELIVKKGILKNFLVHLVNMFDYSLLSPDIVQRTMWQLQVLQDDMEMAGSSGVTQGAAGPTLKTEGTGSIWGQINKLTPGQSTSTPEQITSELVS